MTRLAVSGHRGLPPSTARLVEDALRTEVDHHAGPDLVGLTLLADGPDTMLAEIVLALGGSLIVVVPAQQYRDGLPAEHHASYDKLIRRASEVIRLDRIESNSEAHMAASLAMLDVADHLIAVWDGQPARGHGGTADVVAAARERGLPVTVVWPVGARREG